MTDKIKKSLDFVARHYRKGAFPEDTSFMTGLMSGISASHRAFRRRLIIAAASAACVIVAVAAVITFINRPAPEPAQPVIVEQTQPETNPAPEKRSVDEVVRLEFSNATLAEVITKIEETYDLKVTNLPEDMNQRLTLSYEGNAADLIVSINEVLGTNLKIANN